MRTTKGFLITIFYALLIAVFNTAGPAFAGELDLEKYAGRVVYLDFWASWCTPCKQSFPFMNELKAEFEEQGLAVVSVNIDQYLEDAANFLKQTPADFEVIYDPESRIFSEFAIRAMPTCLLFDRNGKLVGTHVGFKEQDVNELRLSIQALLAKE